MNTLLDRFCRYVRINTTADEAVDDLSEHARADWSSDGC